jgi:translation initiation factor 5A
MVLKIIDAYDAKPGAVIMIDGHAATVRSNDISKSGKHGASKCRIEAIEILTGKKKVLAVPGHQRFDVPMIEKKKAQVLNVSGDKVSVMDLETYETLELSYLPELKEQLAPEKQVEYWDIEGVKAVMRVL